MKILCYGDSNTFGYDPRSWQGEAYDTGGWPELLGTRTGWQVVNGGQNGRQIPHRDYQLRGALRFLRHHSPAELLIVMLGTNDLLQGISAAETGARMEIFLREISSVCSNLLLLSPPPLELGDWVRDNAPVAASRQLSGILEALAGRLGIAFVNTHLWEPELAFDGVHLTGQGHLAFARELEALLRRE